MSQGPEKANFHEGGGDIRPYPGGAVAQDIAANAGAVKCAIPPVSFGPRLAHTPAGYSRVGPASAFGEAGAPPPVPDGRVVHRGRHVPVRVRPHTAYPRCELSQAVFTIEFRPLSPAPMMA